MKNIFYLFIFLFANAIYGGPCNNSYTFSYGTNSNCVYWFLPSVPGTPTIQYITFTIGSTGSYATTCDTAVKSSSDTFYFRFCFHGNHDVTMLIHFASGQTCTVVQTINVTCSGSDSCDPDPARADIITDPTVEITYISPDTCDNNASATVAGCMSSYKGGGHYYIACGWKWAIRLPPGQICYPFSIYVQYDSITTCGNSTCVQRILDTNIICISTYIDQTIYIVATTNSCCLPSGYQRGYFWTPTPTGGIYTTIDDPTPTISTQCQRDRNCTYGISYCVENPVQIDQLSGWAGSCFSGGGNKVEQRDYLKLDDNFTKEQDLIIYNIQGIEVFKGKWKFGDSSNLYLDWPNGIGSGLYFVRFQNSTRKGITKLFKFN